MSSTAGIQPVGNYAGAANDQAAVDILLALVPNPDSGIGSDGAKAGANSSYLDEMSPAAAAQLRVELTALRAAVGTTNTL